jgi:hypothetical protein
MERERELETGIPARLTLAEGRKFGLLVGGAFLAVAALMWWRDHETATYVAAALGAGLFVAGVAIPGRLGPVYRAWMKLALLISKVTTPIFMGVLFFLVLTPAGLLARLVGHRALSRTRGAPTHWRSRPEGARQGSMDHQF